MLDSIKVIRWKNAAIINNDNVNVVIDGYGSVAISQATEIKINRELKDKVTYHPQTLYEKKLKTSINSIRASRKELIVEP